MSELQAEIVVRNSANPDPELFYELVSTRTLTTHHISQPNSLSDPFYCVEKHRSLSKKKPDMAIYRGDSKTGPVLGVVRLGLREHAIGIGDPDTLMEEGNIDQRVVWEHLRRSNKWSHKAYEFEYGNAEGQRMKYTWHWTNRGVLRIARDLELHAESPNDGEGEIVAIYKRTDWRNVKRGSFFIKKRCCGDREEDGKNWELIVLLTALGILEIFTRK